MQNQNTVRICDNSTCAGCNGNPGPTTETIVNGVTNRPDVNWYVSALAQRSGDNVQLNPEGTLLQFCQPSCIAEYYTAVS